MVAKEFLRELREVHSAFEWRLVPQTQWVPERRSRPRFSIRATSADGTSLLFDPIGAVCYARNGRAWPEDSWLEAATDIELSLIDAGDLVAATEDRTWEEVDGQRQPREYVQRLRTSIIDSIGLKLPDEQK